MQPWGSPAGTTTPEQSNQLIFFFFKCFLRPHKTHFPVCFFFFSQSILSVLDDGDVSCNPSSPSSLQPLDAVCLSGLFPLISSTLIAAPYVKMLDDVLLLRDVCLLEFISACLDTITRCHGCLSLPDPLVFTELSRSAFSFCGPEVQFVPVSNRTLETGILCTYTSISDLF